MLLQVVSGLVMAAFEVALLACAVAALAGAIIWVIRLQARTYQVYLSRYFEPRLLTQYHDLGLRLRPRLLSELLRFHAVELLSNCTCTTVAELPRWTLNLVTRLEASFKNPEVIADTIGAKRETLRQDLLMAAQRIEWRYELIRLALCISLAVVLCLFVVDYSFLSTLGSGALTVFTGSDSSVAARLLSGVLCGFVASVGIGLVAEPRLGKDRAPDAPPLTEPDAEAHGDFTIGKPGEALRAINFSAGAFDTVMHLGVIHALSVLQGKAPDAVVGLSVGALNAVALAEVFQAGEEAEKAQLKGSSFHSFRDDPEMQFRIQHMRLVARARRLREFIDAAHQAPEELVRALLPDAYQIDEARPLAPLRQPRFDPKEREQRAEFVASRAGLARLYNQILDIPFSVGSLTKIIRRALGIRAAFELSAKLSATVVFACESVRLWVLLGQNLLPAASLARVLRRTVMSRGKSLRPATAGLLIFRSRVWVETKRLVGYSFTFLVLFFIWYSISLVALPIWAVVTLGVSLLAAWKSNAEDLRIVALDVRQGAWAWLALMVGFTALLWIIPYLYAPHPPAISFTKWSFDFPALFDFYTRPFQVLALTFLVVLLIVMRARSNPRRLSVRFLARYGLNQSLFRPHGLRSYMIQLFDRAYYARPTVDAAVDAALRRKDEGHVSMRPAARKTISHYASQHRLPGEQILVGLAVANTETSGLTVAPADAPLIDALSAATALTPFLPPVELPTLVNGLRRRVLYIDGSKVSHEPTHALLSLVRKYRNKAGHGPLHIYSVTPYPNSKLEMPEFDQSGTQRKKPYLDLIDIVRRAMRLRRFRDASLERRLTELVSLAIPGDDCVAQGPNDVVLRAWIGPVELEHDNALNLRILGANRTDRRQLIEETIADGCRAAMQAMIPNVFKKSTTLKCSEAVRRHIESRPLAAKLKQLRFSGDEKSPGPGLCEICNRCSLNRAGSNPDEEQALRKGLWKTTLPAWPHEREEHARKVSPRRRFKRKYPEEYEQLVKAWRSYREKDPAGMRWPRDIGPAGEHRRAGNSRPTNSLIFSGGVFRGVFQVGVLNGLNEVGLQPDLVAGASVGSITAAMVARTFSHEDDKDDPAVRTRVRHTRIARLAGAFITIDRLILTDRFADFVRNLTVRAADTRFSIRDADQVFRKYDYPAFPGFERKVRNVVAGIERLLYVSPYDLNELVRAIRTDNNAALFSKVNERLQCFLNRMQISEEALGAEALEELIERHVTQVDNKANGAVFTTDTLREEHGIQFLATTTNLRRGKLEVLGNGPGTPDNPAPPLTKALLASSAFPGIFRPLWAWELAAQLNATDRFVDGGVMDNLPLDAIANFLDRAARVGMVRTDPGVPHLMVGASLEVNAPPYALTFTRERFKSSWPLLSSRARQLSYNTKLDTYEHAEAAIRYLRRKLSDQSSGPGDKPLLSLQLVSIKPNWLCGTFGVHPMLGFRRTNQMKSIAHGCACTIRRFGELHADLDKETPGEASRRFKGWGLPERMPTAANTWSEAFDAWAKRDRPREGECWLRDGRKCPFSKGELEKLSLEPALVREVSRIYEYCIRKDTHLREI